MASKCKTTQDAVKRLQVTLQAIKGVYRTWGDNLASWWAHQGENERLVFLKGWCVAMPLAPGKPYCIIDGKKEDLCGVATLWPQLNQQELLQGDTLMQLIREVGKIQGPEGYDDFTELCIQHMSAAQGLVGKIKTQLPREQQIKGLVNFMPGKDFGQTLVVKQMVPSLQTMVNIGALIPAPVFEALLRRLEVVLTAVAGCLDHFRVEVAGRPGYKAIAAELGCAKCGALQAEDGTAVKMCRACGVVFYCSKECQRAHWREHKPHCKPKPDEAGGASSSAAAAPPPAAAATASAAPAAAAATAPSQAATTAATAAGSNEQQAAASS